MEHRARAFEQPLDSAAHRDLAENGWVAGEFVTIRYWLGRLLHRNLFRVSDDAVKIALHQYFTERGQPKGASLVSDLQAWGPVAILLQHHVVHSAGRGPTKNSRIVAALDAVMTNPELTDSQLAALANTTEKQISRMSDVFVLRKIWKHRTAQ